VVTKFERAANKVGAAPIQARANIFFPPHSGHEKKKLRFNFSRGNFITRTFREVVGRERLCARRQG
jgi:hypothetical protein